MSPSVVRFLTFYAGHARTERPPGSWPVPSFRCRLTGEQRTLAQGRKITGPLPASPGGSTQCIWGARMPGEQHWSPAQVPDTTHTRKHHSPAMTSALVLVLTPGLRFLNFLSGLRVTLLTRKTVGNLNQSHSPAWHTSGGCVQELLLVPPGTQSLLPLPPSPTAGPTTQGSPGALSGQEPGLCLHPVCRQIPGCSCR